MASALLLALYAQGGWAWPLGFVALVPWLLALDGSAGVRGALWGGWLLAVGLVLTVFGWFGLAIGAYSGLGSWAAMALLVLGAPLLQPQLFAYVLVRRVLRSRIGVWPAALGSAAAWVGCEWALPKLLGDTLGHGLAPSEWLRQAADLAGATGLTVVLLLVNEAVARLLVARRAGVYPWRPLLISLLLPMLLAGYGAWRLSILQPWLEPDPSTPVLRIGLVQTGLVDYERRRREAGTYAVVREILDTHFGMSQAAVARQGADALLWSETVYPTTFGQPQSAEGAAFDQEILDLVDALQVPLLFGTYERDAAGEYNAAALVEPGQGLRARYRKSHLFPWTEQVPGWLDSARLRALLPWTGRWIPGDGPRVLPLRARDGRELNVLPLICLDAVRPQLALAGAQLGAQAIVTLSNDAWFSASPAGARLHLWVSAFRSIETRLPQLRVTPSGHTAIIDVSGRILVQTGLGDQALLVGGVPILDPPSAPMVRWGDWLGASALGLLAALLLLAGLPRPRRLERDAMATLGVLWWLPAGWRMALAALRLLAALALAWLGWRMLAQDGLQVQSLQQIRVFAGWVVLPLVLAWALSRWLRASVDFQADQLVIDTGPRRIGIPLSAIDRVALWRMPLPQPGVDLLLRSGARIGVGLARPRALLERLRAAGVPSPWTAADDRRSEHLEARASARHWLDHAALKYALFPLLLSLPAFRLHQIIAFGGTFGELQTFGAGAWWTGLLLWWAAWALGLMLLGAVLRLLIELLHRLLQVRAIDTQYGARLRLEAASRAVYYLGVPLWLGWRLLGD